jgi:hypothetical protein
VRENGESGFQYLGRCFYQSHNAYIGEMLTRILGVAVHQASDITSLINSSLLTASCDIQIQFSGVEYDLIVCKSDLSEQRKEGKNPGDPLKCKVKEGSIRIRAHEPNLGVIGQVHQESTQTQNAASRNPH